MNGRQHVYLAGPSSTLAQAVQGGRAILQAGHVPFFPFSSASWSSFDRLRLEACACLVRLPGDSPMADLALAHARRCGMPIYVSIAACLEDLPALTEVR